MKIEVKLFNELRRYKQGEKNVFPVKLDPDSRVDNLLTKLQIPRTTARIILVNGRRVDEKTQLCSGDTVVFFRR